MRGAIWMGLMAAVLAVGCGSSSKGIPDSGTAAPSGPTITIQGYTFKPAELTVDAGTSIAIVNLDSMVHTVTSEASDNAFSPGGVNGVTFDSGDVQPSTGGTGNPYGGGYAQSPSRAATATASITIPANAPSGTVIPYYCSVHTNTMATPNGHITVR